MVDIDKIILKYYEFHEKPTDIANELNISAAYVTKVIKKDSRYQQEKEYRLNINKEKRKISKRDWIRNKRKADYERELNEVVKTQHIIDVKELSDSNEISNSSFIKWNRSIYTYDKKSSDLVIRKEFKNMNDIPKRASNIVHTKSIKSNKLYV